MNYIFFLFMFFILTGCGGGAGEFTQEDKAQLMSLFGKKQEAQEQKALAQSKSPEDMMTAMSNIINPFLTTEEQKRFKVTSFRDLLPLQLTAIFYSEESRRAIIDGQVLAEGDTFGNKTIIKINPKEVIMRDEKAEFVVPLYEIEEENLEKVATN